jgi:hypothetical protein
MGLEVVRHFGALGECGVALLGAVFPSARGAFGGELSTLRSHFRVSQNPWLVLGVYIVMNLFVFVFM